MEKKMVWLSQEAHKELSLFKYRHELRNISDAVLAALNSRKDMNDHDDRNQSART